MFKQKKYFTICLIVLTSLVRAITNPILIQAQADFKKVNASYAKLESYSIDTYYTVYTEHNTQERLESKNGKYVKYKSNSYTMVDDIQTYTINDKIISINKGDKLISVGDNTPSDTDPLGTNSDSLLTMCSDIKVETINAHEKKYTLLFDNAENSEYNKVEISINTLENRYTKLVLFYNMEINLKSDFYADAKQPRLEIMYKNFKLLTADPQIFNDALYIVNDNEKLKPAPKYYNYRLVDLRNKTRIKKNK
ncbi:MAG: hypothetical protein SFY56_06815 [Bacteroidota bacterium]|nr:hypothetical protein [Bacteroidota bacterium]